MSLSEQENRCVQVICKHFESAIGGIWAIESYPDELFPMEPTPEVIITNGKVITKIIRDMIYVKNVKRSVCFHLLN